MKCLTFQNLANSLTKFSVPIVLFSLIGPMVASHAQSPASIKPNDTVNSNHTGTPPVQAPLRVIIDGNQLINQQTSQPKVKPQPNETQSSTPAPNNVRIGSGGQYSDSNSGTTEQINSSGKLCQTNQGMKKCY